MGKGKKQSGLTRAEAIRRRSELLIDEVIGLIAPKNALSRKRARAALDNIRRYEGAGRGRRYKGWHTTNAGPNDILVGSLPLLQSRSKDLVRNNPHIKRAVDVIVNNTVGNGIVPQTLHSNPKVFEAHESLWMQWGETTACDADGNLDFYGLQSLAFKTVAESGSVLIRKRTRRITDGLPLPLQLQLLEPDHLDTTKDGVLQNGNVIIHGIEFDQLGRRVAYHIFKDHPQSNIVGLRTLASQRIKASEVIHMFRPERIGQQTGVPWVAPVILRSKDLDDYEDAQLFRQKIAACFTAFIRDIEASDDPQNETDNDYFGSLEPGAVEKLPPGKDILFSDPPGADGYGDYVRNVLRAIAAGFGITYEALTTDYSQVNFSSARMGWREFYLQIEAWRNHIIKPKMCVTAWNWFSEAAYMAGLVRETAPATWTSPRREMIDPVKETIAIKEQIRSGLKSRSEAIREMGFDPIAVEKEIAEENARADKLHLKFDSDPRSDDLSLADVMQDDA